MSSKNGEYPFVSVVISNRNSGEFLRSCISTILANHYPNYEVIIVDNASFDESIKLIESSFACNPEIKIILNKKDLGPAAGRNVGIRNARGKYVAFLDSDTEVDSSWLTELVKVMEDDQTIGAAQSKLLLGDKRELDSCGHFLTPFGFVFEVGIGEVDEGQRDSIREIFGAKSAAMIIQRDIIDTIGVFDKDYFMVWEETDLCWRVWLAGYKILFVPKSVVYHFRGGSIAVTGFSMRLYQGAKNGIRTLIKNMEFKNLLLMLPLYLASNLLLAVYFANQKKTEYSKAIIKGVLWNFRFLGKTLRDRSHVQRYVRKVKDNELAPFMFPNKSLIFFYHKGKAWLNRMRW